MSEPVLVAGAGYVGGALARELVDGGREVWALTRTRALEAPIRSLRADVADRQALGAALAPLPRTLGAVVYAISAGGPSDEAYRRAYVEGLSALLEVLSGRRLGRLIFVSSTAVYEQTDGAWVDETSPTEPQAATGRRLLEAEALAATAPAERRVVARLAGIYGPGRTRLIERVKAGERIAVPGRHANRIHQSDGAGALAHLVRLAEPPPVVVVSDDEPAELAEVERWLCARLGLDPGALVGGEGQGPRRRAGNKRCRNALLRATGYRLRYPSFRDGYAPLLTSSAATR